MPENSLLNDVLNIAHDAAVEKSYISAAAVQILRDASRAAARRANFPAADRGRGETTGDVFASLRQSLSGLDDQKANHLSRIAALDSIVVNAVSSAERAVSLPSPEERIGDYLKDTLRDEASREATVARLKETLDSAVISLVHTMHPTIYHSPDARKFESDLTRLLEDPKNVSTTSGSPRLTEEGRDAAAKLFFGEFLAKLATGKATITPKKPMTVSLETQTEEDNYRAIGEQIKAVIKGWNNAVAKVPGLTDSQRGQLTISPEREKSMIEFRSWGNSADADGREKSTSQFLFESLARRTEDGKYKGHMLDLRQNAKKVHLPLMSALVQVKMRNAVHGRYEKGVYEEPAGIPTFDRFCEDFMRGREEKYEQRNGTGELGWQGTQHSLIQQLDSDDRADFITKIIQNGYDLVPNQMRKDALEFNPSINDLKRDFCKRYEKEIIAAQYDPETIDFDQMLKVTVKHPEEDVKVSLRAVWDAEVKNQKWQIMSGGLQYQRWPDKKHPTAAQMLVTNFLQGTLKPAGKDSFETLNEQERATFTDVVKRLMVIDDAIEKHGAQAATRYQIANFSEAADFLIVLKLFEEAGLVKIENGRVTNAKMGIMPLLETEEDLKSARAVFSQLLDNPVSRSFWEKRGEADIMVGFSDGAASAGNFASQWAIYKATRELTELFEKRGIKVRFLQGRGRGTDRGGTIDPSLQMDLMPPEIAKRGIYDVTIQSDLPMDLAASKAYGEDYFTRMLVGTLDASLKAPQRVQPEEKAKLAGHEEAIDWIASRASEIYQKIVRNDSENGPLPLLNALPDNPNRSSRAVARGGAAKFKKFDDIRAITKEYLFNGIDLPVYNVGLKQALSEFEKLWDAKGQWQGKGREIVIHDASGAKVTGSKALGALKEHPFFRSVMKTIRAGMEHYDPNVAHAYGELTKSQQFVGTAMFHLDHLATTIDRIMGNANERMASSWRSALDQVAHGVIIESLDKGKPRRPDLRNRAQKQWSETLFNSLFATAQEVSHRELPREKQVAAARG